MNSCPCHKECQVLVEPLFQAPVKLPNIKSLRAKRKAKHNRFVTRNVGTSDSHSQRIPWKGSNSSPCVKRHRPVLIKTFCDVAVDRRRTMTEVFRAPDFHVFITSLVRRLFPVVMMVAALLFILNIVVLINLPVPNIRDLLNRYLVESMLILPSTYLTVGIVLRLLRTGLAQTQQVSTQVTLHSATTASNSRG